MKNTKGAAILVILAVTLFYVGQGAGPLPDDPTPIVPPDAPNFLPVFQEAIAAQRVDRLSAKAHAHALSTLCYESGSILEWDGKLPKPEIETARQFIATRTMIRNFRERGGSFSEVYPKLGSVIQEYLSLKVGRDDKAEVDDNTMTEAKRRDYVSAYRDGLAPAFLKASKEL